MYISVDGMLLFNRIPYFLEKQNRTTYVPRFKLYLEYIFVALLWLRNCQNVL